MGPVGGKRPGIWRPRMEGLSIRRIIAQYASRLRFPRLFLLAAALLVLDVLTAMLGSLKKRRGPGGE